jgi:hypothetical protein
VKPGGDMTNDGALVPFAEGVWIDSEPVRIVGMPLTSMMTACAWPAMEVRA